MTLFLLQLAWCFTKIFEFILEYRPYETQQCYCRKGAEVACPDMFVPGGSCDRGNWCCKYCHGHCEEEVPTLEYVPIFI